MTTLVVKSVTFSLDLRGFGGDLIRNYWELSLIPAQFGLQLGPDLLDASTRRRVDAPSLLKHVRFTKLGILANLGGWAERQKHFCKSLRLGWNWRLKSPILVNSQRSIEDSVGI